MLITKKVLLSSNPSTTKTDYLKIIDSLKDKDPDETKIVLLINLASRF